MRTEKTATAVLNLSWAGQEKGLSGSLYDLSACKTDWAARTAAQQMCRHRSVGAYSLDDLKGTMKR